MNNKLKMKHEFTLFTFCVHSTKCTRTRTLFSSVLFHHFLIFTLNCSWASYWNIP